MDLAPASAAVVTNISVSGPSLATGMSRDQANAGGSHEVATALLSEPCESFCREAGTSPGACSSERDEFGATNSIPATALGMRGDAPRADALPLNVSLAGVDTPSIRDASLEGRGPVEDWTDGCLAVRAVIYPARRGASHRAFNSACEDRESPSSVF
jgi:hypothetical protein